MNSRPPSNASASWGSSNVPHSRHSDSATVAELGADAFYAGLRTDGIRLRIGPFTARIQSNAAALEPTLFRLYRHYPLTPSDSIFSFHARLDERRGLLPRRRRWVRFSVDGRVPHEDMPASQSLAVLEWGLNLVIAMRTHHLLMLHSAVLEKNGRALLLPAEPGFGKTTLCAALAHSGWRLFSDEFGLLRPEDGQLLPAPRPMPLKNESVDVIRQFAPIAEIGETIPETRKGDVAHVAPPADSVRRMHETAAARLILFPRWRAGADCRVARTGRFETFMRLATNAFNYEMLGETAFRAVASLVESAESYRLVYSRLDDAVALIDRLAESGAG